MHGAERGGLGGASRRSPCTTAAAPAAGSLLAERHRSLYLSVRQRLVDCEGLDPLLLASLVLGGDDLRSSTLFGDWMLRHVEDVIGVGDDAEITLEELAEVARATMGRFKLCPVRPVPRRSMIGGGQLPRVSVREGKKATAIALFIEQCEKKGMDYCCPSLIQVKYPSGARVHEIHSHPSECLMWCRDVVMDRARTALVLMEVPNFLQMLHCFYIDWDMVVDDFTFATDPGAWPELDHAAHGEDAGLEYVRRVAMDTPRVVCGILADAGYVAHGSTVQVVVVEGTRGRKVGIHFVFKTLATRETHREVWGAILEAIEARVGRSAFQEVIRKREDHVVDAASREAMGDELFCLIGMDMHPFQTMEQGLALPFSRKTPEDPVSRPIAIIHVEAGGEESMWEVPCRMVWRAGHPIRGPHPDVAVHCSPLVVLASLLDSSICIPSPRCVGLAPRGGRACSTPPPPRTPTHRNTPAPGGSPGGPVDGQAGWCTHPPPATPPPTSGSSPSPQHPLALLGMDESSTCSTSSIFSTVASWPTSAPAQRSQRGRQPGGGGGGGAQGHPSDAPRGSLRERAVQMRAIASGVPVGGMIRPNAAVGPRWLGGEPRSSGAGERGATTIPEWFLSAARAACPGFDSHIYSSPRYGSRPSCAQRGGGMFQVNGTPLAMCVRAACHVPFNAFRSHTNNGTLFYVDGGDVYASCMKRECQELLRSDRERMWHMARRIELLVLHGEDGACTPEEISRHPFVSECLRDEDVDALSRISSQCALGSCGKRPREGTPGRDGGGALACERRARQFDLGCHDFYHGRYLVTDDDGGRHHPAPAAGAKRQRFHPPGFVPVPACRRKKDARRPRPGARGLGGGRCGDGVSAQGAVCGPPARPPCSCSSVGAVSASDHVGVPSRDRWDSLDGKRTWVRVTPGLLDAHIRSVVGSPAGPVHEAPRRGVVAASTHPRPPAMGIAGGRI